MLPKAHPILYPFLKSWRRTLAARLLYILIPVIAGAGLSASASSALAPVSFAAESRAEASAPAEFPFNFEIFLPVVRRTSFNLSSYAPYRVNLPFFPAAVEFTETAIFWFGRVSPSENYADVRAGYTADELFVHISAYDRNLWFDQTPSSGDLTAWDAVSLLVDTTGPVGAVPAASSYRFESQLNWSGPRTNYQAAYQGTGSGWQAAAIDFSTEADWRGNAPNNDSQNDRGWTTTFHIPFDSLGITGPPVGETVWGLALLLHDRDSEASNPLPEKFWPPGMAADEPNSWGQMAFGLPTFEQPAVEPSGTTTIRNGLDGALVVDGMVGGGFTCGEDLDWMTWGQANYAGAHQVNIQDQYDIADWPCFSKLYVTFPLAGIPANATVISATLALHQFSNAGGPGEAKDSLIQVLTVGEDWDANTLSWNSAPLAIENVSRAWVEPIEEFPGWPGLKRTWDVSMAVGQALGFGIPLRLALYSADAPYHSGKYFTSSVAGDWNSAGRPTLTVEWGSP